MFVGHYTASYIAKGLEPRASLALLFVAAQFLDFVFFPLVLLDIEQLVMIPHATASTHFELPFMPYSHSIFAALLWTVLVFILSRRVLKLSLTVSLLLSLVVAAHWALDLLVHTPDLAVWNILSIDASKWGMGLWNKVHVAFALEALLLIGSMVFYLKRTQATSKAGELIMPLFVASLLAIQAFTTYGGLAVSNKSAFALQAIVAFIVFVIIAGYADRFRTGRQN